MKKAVKVLSRFAVTDSLSETYKHGTEDSESCYSSNATFRRDPGDGWQAETGSDRGVGRASTAQRQSIERKKVPRKKGVSFSICTPTGRSLPITVPFHGLGAAKRLTEVGPTYFRDGSPLEKGVSTGEAFIGEVSRLGTVQGTRCGTFLFVSPRFSRS